MAPWEDPRVRIPGEVAVRLAWVAAGVTQRVIEWAVSGGLALVSVGTGRILLDSACKDLGEDASETSSVEHLAA